MSPLSAKKAGQRSCAAAIMPRLYQEIVMLTKVATALIAVTLFAAPLLAQSVAPEGRAPATQPIAVKSPKQVKIKKHTVKKVIVARHRTHIKHVRHVNSAKSAHIARASTKPTVAQSRTN
jgi:hypothetical protein